MNQMFIRRSNHTKNKVCILTSVHSPFDTRIFFKEAKSLAKAGYDVTLIAQHNKNEMVDNVKIIALPKAKNRIHRMIGLTLKAFWLALNQKAYVYHFHDPELIPIGLLLKFLGKKVIYDVHEDVPDDILIKEWIPITIRQIISLIFKIFENWAARRMTFIITATPYIRDRFQKRLGTKVMDINNYPILDELCLSDIDWYQKEHAVCYVGIISKIRGIFEMIEVISKTDARLLLAGQFSNVKIRDDVTNMIGWANVEELGQLNRAEIAQILSRSLAGLVLFHPVPDHTYSQPNKMFEYMSAGIPVIASNFPLWKEIVEGNNCGICVNPLKPKEIADAIQWIIDHPEDAKRMGENGRRAVKEKYNWEYEGIKLLKVYENLFSNVCYK